MSVIISGDKLIVHSYMVPVVFDSIQEPGVRYLIADGKWTPIPNHLGYKHITHFQKEYKGAKNEAFKNTFEQEVVRIIQRFSTVLRLRRGMLTVRREIRVRDCQTGDFLMSINSPKIKN